MQKKDQVFLYIKDEIEKISSAEEKEILELADEKIKIPMPGKTESLNASVATAVILYEAMRNKLK